METTYAMKSWDVPARDGVSQMWVAWDGELDSYVFGMTTPQNEDLPEQTFPTVMDLVKGTWPVVDWATDMRNPDGAWVHLHYAQEAKVTADPRDSREQEIAAVLRSVFSGRR